MSDDESVGSDLEDLNGGRTGQYKDDAQDSSFNVDDLDNLNNAVKQAMTTEYEFYKQS